MAGARHMQFGNEEALVDLMVIKVAIVKKTGPTSCVLYLEIADNVAFLQPL